MNAVCARPIKRLALDLMDPRPISTPCIKVCAVSGQLGLCIGCGRTLPEIASWGSLDEARRQEIMAELPARLAAVPAST